MAPVNLDAALLFSIALLKDEIYRSSRVFTNYSRGYFLTNENIDGYLQKEQFNPSKALTILGSGDHVFNLISHGFQSIDAMDINNLEYYVYFLKKCAIENLSFREFLYFIDSFYQKGVLGFSDVLKKLKGKLEEEIYAYFRRLIEIGKTEEKLAPLYYCPSKDTWMKGNAYLKEESAYLDLRRKLQEADVHLFFGDARDLIPQFSSTYDIILLSNILDYFGILQKTFTLEEYEHFLSMCMNLLKQDGLVIGTIFWLGAHIDDPNYYPFSYSSVKLSDIGMENISILPNTFGHGYFRVRKP